MCERFPAVLSSLLSNVVGVRMVTFFVPVVESGTSFIAARAPFTPLLGRCRARVAWERSTKGRHLEARAPAFINGR